MHEPSETTAMETKGNVTTGQKKINNKYKADVQKNLNNKKEEKEKKEKKEQANAKAKKAEKEKKNAEKKKQKANANAKAKANANAKATRENRLKLSHSFKEFRKPITQYDTLLRELKSVYRITPLQVDELQKHELPMVLNKEVHKIVKDLVAGGDKKKLFETWALNKSINLLDRRIGEVWSRIKHRKDEFSNKDECTPLMAKPVVDFIQQYNNSDNNSGNNPDIIKIIKIIKTLQKIQIHEKFRNFIQQCCIFKDESYDTILKELGGVEYTKGWKYRFRRNLRRGLFLSMRHFRLSKGDFTEKAINTSKSIYVHNPTLYLTHLKEVWAGDLNDYKTLLETNIIAPNGTTTKQPTGCLFELFKTFDIDIEFRESDFGYKKAEPPLVYTGGRILSQKKKSKIYTGSRGGKYMLKGGKKVYL